MTEPHKMTKQQRMNDVISGLVLLGRQSENSAASKEYFNQTIRALDVYLAEEPMDEPLWHAINDNFTYIICPP